MATYGTNQYPYGAAKRRKQRHVILEKVFDMSNYPYKSTGQWLTKAWAAGDVLQAIGIRAGQTVMGIQIEVITPASRTATHYINIGTGDNAGLFGGFDLGKNAYKKTDAAKVGTPGWLDHNDDVSKVDYNNWWKPKYFAAADTIDLTISSTITSGKFRLVVHLLEEDR